MADPKQTSPQRYDLDRVVRLIISAATLLAVIWLLRYLSDVLVPFVVALLIAYLLNPLVCLVESRLKNRAAAVLTTVLGGLALGAVVVAFSIPLLAAQLHDFSSILSELRTETVASLPAATETGETVDLGLAQRFDVLIDSQSDERLRWLLGEVREVVKSEQFDFQQWLVDLGGKIVPGVWGVVTGAVSFVLGLTGLVVVLLYVIFLLNDFRVVEEVWKDQLPPAYREPVVYFLDEFRIAMSRYFRGQFIIAASVGVIFAVGFSLIGLRMGIVLGLFIGALNMVPYLQLVGLIPAGLFAVLRAVEHDSSMSTSLLLTVAVFVVAQLVQDAILVPRIMGKATGLRPAIILLGVFVWGKILGFLGLVLAIPLTCLGLAYYRRWVLRLRNVQVVANQE